ncbi:MAG: hypothetical protein IT256_08650 [Chitinophagaceae bacterium]|nr:hypothetical protein [Chitinophagaceae bacterium]
MNFDASKPIVISRKLKYMFGSDYFNGHMRIQFDEEKNGNHIEIQYLRTKHYDGAYRNLKNQLVVNVKDAKQFKQIGLASNLFNEWHTEQVVYHPNDGYIAYYRNGELQGAVQTGLIINKNSKFRLWFSPFGWWTGHSQAMDDLVVSQNKDEAITGVGNSDNSNVLSEKSKSIVDTNFAKNIRTDGYYTAKLRQLPIMLTSKLTTTYSYKQSMSTIAESGNLGNRFYRNIVDPTIGIRFFKNGYVQFFVGYYHYYDVGLQLNLTERDYLSSFKWKIETPTEEDMQDLHYSTNGAGLAEGRYLVSCSPKMLGFEIPESTFRKNYNSFEFPSGAKYDLKHRFTLNRNNGTLQYDYIADSTNVLYTQISEPLLFKQEIELDEDYIKKDIEKKRLEEIEKQKQQEIERKRKLKEEEENRKRAIVFEQNRILKIKSSTIGDRICYSQDWVYTESNSGFFGFGAYENKINYKMMLICYIEKKEGNKLLVRVAKVKSNNETHSGIPTYKGVSMFEGSEHWVNPYTDNNWILCDD